jgi:hypothetical protein
MCCAAFWGSEWDGITLWHVAALVLCVLAVVCYFCVHHKLIGITVIKFKRTRAVLCCNHCTLAVG